MLGAQNRRDLRESGLRRAVSTPALVRREGRVGNDVDYPRPGGEMWPRELGASASGAKTFASYTLRSSLIGVSGQRGQRTAVPERAAGVVDEEIDRLPDRIHEPTTMVGIGYVPGHRDHIGEPGNRTLEPRRRTRIDRELPTAPRKSTSEREPPTHEMRR